MQCFGDFNLLFLLFAILMKILLIFCLILSLLLGNGEGHAGELAEG
jgi:hypothetical protein